MLTYDWTKNGGQVISFQWFRGCTDSMIAALKLAFNALKTSCQDRVRELSLLPSRLLALM